MTALVTIASTPIPDPSTYECNTATIVDSARNLDGLMVGAVIRDDVMKVSMKWNFLTAQQWANILKLFSPANGGNFTNSVTAYCQDTNTWATRTMYVSDRNAGVWLRAEDGSIRGYTNCSMSLIEV